MKHQPIDLNILSDMLNFIDSDDRDIWVKSLMAIKSEFGADGEDTARSWSQQSNNYKASDFRDTWKSCKHGAINIGWLIRQALDSGYKFAPISDLERARLNADAMMRSASNKKRLAEEQQQLEQQYLVATEKAESILNKCSHAPTDHPYLVQKQIQPFGIVAHSFPGYQDTLVIPVGGSQEPFIGRFQSLQFIMPDGSKRFLKGGKKAGGYFPIQWVADAPIVICEGFATGATLAEHYTANSSVICAFDAGNLKKVAKVFRRQYPTSQIIIAGDNDRFTKDGFPASKNVGEEAAREAAAAVDGYVTIPSFEDNETGSDWNDFYLLDAKKEVKNA